MTKEVMNEINFQISFFEQEGNKNTQKTSKNNNKLGTEKETSNSEEES